MLNVMQQAREKRRKLMVSRFDASFLESEGFWMENLAKSNLVESSLRNRQIPSHHERSIKITCPHLLQPHWRATEHPAKGVVFSPADRIACCR